jgi:hypothetical protein
MSTIVLVKAMPRTKVTTKTKTTKKESVKKDTVHSSDVDTPRRSFVPRFNVDQKTIGILVAVLALAILSVLLYRWLIVAWVDGMPVTRIGMYQEMNKRYGETTKTQLITEKLILSEAQKRKVTVSDAEVDAEFKKYETQLGSHDQLISALKMQGMDETEFRKQIRIQQLVQKMFGSNIAISDDEVNQYYQQNKQGFATGTDEANASPSAEVKTQITDELRQQKVSTAFQEWLTQAQASPRVKKIQ